MKRMTVYLEESVDLELSRLAERRGRSKAELIWEALAKLVKEQLAEEQNAATGEALPSWLGAGDSGDYARRERQADLRPFPRSVGMGRSSLPNGAERDEEILLELLEKEHEEIIADYEARQQR